MATEILQANGVDQSGSWVDGLTTPTSGESAKHTYIDEGVATPDGYSVVKDSGGDALILSFPSPSVSTSSVTDIQLRVRLRSFNSGQPGTLRSWLRNGTTILGFYPDTENTLSTYVNFTLDHSDEGNGPPYSDLSDLNLVFTAQGTNYPEVDAAELWVNYEIAIQAVAEMPVEFLASPAGDHVFPVAWLGPATSEYGIVGIFPVEWEGYGEVGFAFDFNVSWLGSPTSDHVLPVEWLADFWAWYFPVEWTAEVALTCIETAVVDRDAVFPIEWLGADECSPFPVSWTGTHDTDTGLPIEHLLATITDSDVVPIEHVLDAYNDAALPVSWLSEAEVSVVATLPVEWRVVLVIDADADLNVDWLGSPVFDPALNIDWALSLEFDSTLRTAWALAIEADATTPAAWALAIDQDAELSAAFLGTPAADPSLPFDHLGTLEVDATTPASWNLDVRNDATLPAAWTPSIASGMSSPLAWAGTFPHDATVAIDWQATIDADRTLPAAWALGITTTVSTPIDWQLLVNADISALASWLSSPASDYVLNLDWIGSIELDPVTFPVSWLLLTVVDSDHDFDVDWQAVLDFDHTFNFEWLLLTVLTVDASFAIEYQQGVLATSSAIVSWLASPKADPTLPVSYSGALTATVVCSSEKWVAEDSGTCWGAN